MNKSEELRFLTRKCLKDELNLMAKEYKDTILNLYINRQDDKSFYDMVNSSFYFLLNFISTMTSSLKIDSEQKFKEIEKCSKDSPP